MTIMCHNDEFSSLMSWVGCLVSDSGLPDSTWKFYGNGNNRNFEKNLAIFCK